MKVTRLGPTQPLSTVTGVLSGSSGGTSGGQVPTSNGSNGVEWGPNVATISANGSNTLLGPFVNLASGSNILFTIDQGPAGSSPSNTLRIHSTASGGSSGSSGVTVSDEGTPLATTATTLDFVGAGVTASGTGATKTITIAGGGGGGGVDWIQDISESGTSFANFTANSGTWSSNGTEIIQTDTSATTRRARHNTLVPGALTWLVETELFFVTTGTGNVRAGILIGDPADNGHLWVYVERLSTGQVAVEREGFVQVKTYATTVAHSTWYKLRVAYSGAAVTIWLGGTLLGTTLMTPREDEVYPSLGSYAASVKFRNFKVWTLSDGLPA